MCARDPLPFARSARRSGSNPTERRDSQRRFWRISAAGIFFQGGAAAVDSSTIVAVLVLLEALINRHLWAEVEDLDGERLRAMTYIAAGKETDGRPSLRYLTLLRDGAREHGLPEHYLRFLESVRHAE